MTDVYGGSALNLGVMNIFIGVALIGPANLDRLMHLMPDMGGEKKLAFAGWVRYKKEFGKLVTVSLMGPMGNCGRAALFSVFDSSFWCRFTPTLSLLSKDLAAKALSTKVLGCFSLGLQLRCGAAAHVRIAIGRCECQSSSFKSSNSAGVSWPPAWLQRA